MKIRGIAGVLVTTVFVIGAGKCSAQDVKPRSERINGQSQNGSGANLKQKALLEELNVVHDEEISKAEASRLLDQALQKDQKE